MNWRRLGRKHADYSISRNGAWEHIITIPHMAPPGWILFERDDVAQVQLWFGLCAPNDTFNIRLQAKMQYDIEIEAALERMGRPTDAWSTFESYEDVRYSRPTPQAPWSLMVGNNVIAPGPLMILDQPLLGDVRVEVLQSEGVRRLLLYRYVIRR